MGHNFSRHPARENITVKPHLLYMQNSGNVGGGKVGGGGWRGGKVGKTGLYVCKKYSIPKLDNGSLQIDLS